jgi:hypothetical protein
MTGGPVVWNLMASSRAEHARRQLGTALRMVSPARRSCGDLPGARARLRGRDGAHSTWFNRCATGNMGNAWTGDIGNASRAAMRPSQGLAANDAHHPGVERDATEG